MVVPGIELNDLMHITWFSLSWGVIPADKVMIYSLPIKGYVADLRGDCFPRNVCGGGNRSLDRRNMYHRDAPNSRMSKRRDAVRLTFGALQKQTRQLFSPIYPPPAKDSGAKLQKDPYKIFPRTGREMNPWSQDRRNMSNNDAPDSRMGEVGPISRELGTLLDGHPAP